MAGCLEVVGLWIGWLAFLSAITVGPYVTLQRGPLRAIDCFFTDDIAVEYATDGMTLGEFRSAVKAETRNCVRLVVVSGPDDDNTRVVFPVGTRTILYRGDRTIEVGTAGSDG